MHILVLVSMIVLIIVETNAGRQWEPTQTKTHTANNSYS